MATARTTDRFESASARPGWHGDTDRKDGDFRPGNLRHPPSADRCHHRGYRAAALPAAGHSGRIRPGNDCSPRKPCHGFKDGARSRPFSQSSSATCYVTSAIRRVSGDTQPPPVVSDRRPCSWSCSCNGMVTVSRRRSPSRTTNTRGELFYVQLPHRSRRRMVGEEELENVGVSAGALEDVAVREERRAGCTTSETSCGKQSRN